MSPPKTKPVQNKYSLVLSERHVRKEGCGCTPKLCIGPKVTHDSTSGKSMDPKESHFCNNWLFSVRRVILKFGDDPKESHDCALV